MTIESYWDSLPTSPKEAFTYTDLCQVWRLSPRRCREILHLLSVYDDGADLVLIRSTRGGFYKTSNKALIADYRKQVFNRGRNVFACLQKIDRVLRDDCNQFSIGTNLKLLRNANNMTMSDLCHALGGEITPQIIVSLESGAIVPSYPLAVKLAEIFGVSVDEVVGGLQCND